MKRVQVLIEGHGEESAAQLLIRRIATESFQLFDWDVLRPQRRRGIAALLGNDGRDLARYQRVAESDADRVIWLLDHEDGCFVASLEKVKSVLHEIGVMRPTAIAFLEREYETMFLQDSACCEDLYGVPAAKFYAERGRRDAKGAISRALGHGSAYKPTLDQARLTHRLNFATLRAESPSFLHLERVIRWASGDVGNVVY